MADTEVATGRCGKCTSEIPVEAIKCPECGYEPSSEGGVFRIFMGVLGVGLCLTGVGIVAGVPILFVTYKFSKWQGDLTPTNTSPDADDTQPYRDTPLLASGTSFATGARLFTILPCVSVTGA